eukprot:Pompholyxophrys_punicea_v1_NODE_543_length_1718_cov_2.881539.p3 type:complete len:135 gc:universal NODE_543_length_1718_cov_2.881539:1245-1649(+)
MFANSIFRILVCTRVNCPNTFTGGMVSLQSDKINKNNHEFFLPPIPYLQMKAYLNSIWGLKKRFGFSAVRPGVVNLNFSATTCPSRVLTSSVHVENHHTAVTAGLRPSSSTLCELPTKKDLGRHIAKKSFFPMK